MGVWKFAKEAGIIQNTRKMIDIAKKNGIPVIYVKDALGPEDCVDMDLSQAPLVKQISEVEIFKEGTWGAEYVDELKPEAGDHIIVKRRIGAFSS